MNEQPVRRMLLRALPAALPLLVLAAMALTLAAQQAQQAARTPTPQRIGPFRLSAAYLPAGYTEPLAIQSARQGELGLLAQQTAKPAMDQAVLSWNWSDGALAALPQAIVVPQGMSGRKPGLVGSDGLLLQVQPGQPQPVPGAGQGMVRLVVQLARPAPDGAVRPPDEYRLNVPQYRGRMQWALLADGTLAAVGRRPDSYGVVRLQLCAPNADAVEVQELSGVVLAFPACTEQGQGIAVLTQPGRLHVFEPATRRLEPRPDLDKLGQAIFAGGLQLYSVAMGEDFAVAVYAGSAAARLCAADGTTQAIGQLDPERQRPDGSRRMIPLQLTTATASGGKWQRYAGKLAQEGRSAPVNVTTESPQLAAVSADCVALVDRHYNRVVLVEHDAPGSLKRRAND